MAKRPKDDMPIDVLACAEAQYVEMMEIVIRLRDEIVYLNTRFNIYIRTQRVQKKKAQRRYVAFQKQLDALVGSAHVHTSLLCLDESEFRQLLVLSKSAYEKYTQMLKRTAHKLPHDKQHETLVELELVNTRLAWINEKIEEYGFTEK